MFPVSVNPIREYLFFLISGAGAQLSALIFTGKNVIVIEGGCAVLGILIYDKDMGEDQ